jgi:hypothetical protein
MKTLFGENRSVLSVALNFSGAGTTVQGACPCQYITEVVLATLVPRRGRRQTRRYRLCGLWPALRAVPASTPAGYPSPLMIDLLVEGVNDGEVFQTLLV